MKARPAGGRPGLTADKEIGYGLPMRVPMIDIHTIGAGGGSIARVNSGGVLQVVRMTGLLAAGAITGGPAGGARRWRGGRRRVDRRW